jgi:peptidoglycan endopeptidase LytF
MQSTYTVVKGDTLFGIARRFGLTVDALKALNGLKSNDLKIGQVLKLKKNQPAAPTGNTDINTPPPSPPPPTKAKTYTVVKGDTLFGISRKFGLTVDNLRALNKLTTNDLRVGQVLIVGQTTNPEPAPEPTPAPQPTNPNPPASTGNYLEARAAVDIQTTQDAGFRRFRLRTRVSDGSIVTANMRDNLTQSRHMVYPEGILYAGQSLMELSVPTIQSVGLTLSQAAALQFVSTHEGKFDAINSYDRAIFSYGFIQFVGATAHGASLNHLLANMKANAGTAFQSIFQRMGIDVEGTGRNAVVTVLDERGTRLRGDNAWYFIQKTLPLYAPFVQAGFEPSLVREQLRTANELYVQPALNWKLDINLGTVRVSIPQLRNLIQSEAALTLVFALAINQGVGGMSRTLVQSIESVANRMGLRTQQSLAQLNERALVEDIASAAADDRVIARAQSVLVSGLSFEKLG